MQGVFSAFIHHNKENDKPEKVFTIHQFWSNADLDPKGKNFEVLNFKLSKDHKFILFYLGLSVPVPGALAMVPTVELVRWLESNYKEKEILLRRFVVAPKIEFFVKGAVGEYTLHTKEYFILGVSDHILQLNKSPLKRLLKFLKKKKLPSEGGYGHQNFVSKLKEYN